MKKKIIIIGAGVSGLSLAARLLYKGFDVVIYEKNSRIGGKTSIIKSGNFKFDLTASIAMMPEDLINTFKYCGKNYKNYFSLTPLTPLYRCFYYDNSFYDFHSDFSLLNRTLKSITRHDFDDIYGYYNFLTANYHKYLQINNNILGRSFIKPYNLFRSSVLKNIDDLNVLSSCTSECKKDIKNQKLFEFLMFQSMYIGMSPFNSSSIFNTIPASTQMEGLYYIKGGMYNYILALKKLVIELGGTIKTCNEISDILFNKNNVYGVMCHDKVIKCDAVVCSCDYTNTMTKLIKDKNIKSLFKSKKKHEYSCSVFMLYLALDKKYPILKVHNIYINKDFKKNINAAFKGVLPNNPSLYIYCPSSIDDSLCPEGCSTINIMIRVPNLSYEKINWNFELCLKIKKKILDILSSIKTMEDIKEHILYDNFLTPMDLRDKLNLYHGAAFGISPLLKENLILRPQCNNPKVKNLYFTGADTHPGNGISLCLKSSKICAEKIIKDYTTEPSKKKLFNLNK
ncbi:MAG: phytoene desaturase [Clostridium sp.]|nr:phytoene desaturase [Clostridium sp.]